MKKPKRRTTAQVKAEKKRAAKKSYMRKNKGRKRLKALEAQRRFRIEVEKAVKKQMKSGDLPSDEKEDWIKGVKKVDLSEESWTKDIKISSADNKRK